MRVRYYNWLFDEIATRFGDARLDPIVLKYGGNTINVPKSLTPHFVAVFGKDIGAWLIAERGGGTIYVGSRKALESKRDRSRRNKRLLTAQLTVSELATGEGLSARQVRRIQKNTRLY